MVAAALRIVYRPHPSIHHVSPASCHRASMVKQPLVQAGFFQQYPEANKLDFNTVCMQTIICSWMQDLFLRVNEDHFFFVWRDRIVNIMYKFGQRQQMQGRLLEVVLTTRHLDKHTMCLHSIENIFVLHKFCLWSRWVQFSWKEGVLE